MNINTTENIPRGWTLKKIDEVCLTLKGKGLSKSSIEPNGKNKCILYGQLFTTYKEVISAIKSRTNLNHGTLSKSGDILIPGSTTTKADDLAIASALLEDNVLLGGDINILRKKGNFYDPVFLAYYLTHYKKKDIGKLGQGTTIIHLYGKNLKNIDLCLPLIDEQKKIAEILYSVDSEICKVNELILETKKLKKGLLKVIFNKGINHKKFKKTDLGFIPEEWNHVLLDTVAKRASGHTPSKKHLEYWNGGIKWVSLADSSKLDNRYISSTNKEISILGIENSSAVLLPKNTVIVCRDAGIGKVGIIDTSMAVSQHFIAWQCSEILNYKFLYYFLQSCRSEFERIATGTTIKTIGLPFFKKQLIPLPNIVEQERIAEILWSIDDKVLLYDQLQEKLMKLKKGLMTDLLSGKVRTKI